ncbi:glycosyltransferase family 4 protein [Brevibacterium sp. 50QC2O2]|uniref:glycosyltransferase family 4 protein n=1 Tax=Brevibacterium sp. 50QC2O2 TaxID=2968459 RepID=UPI00211CFF76|nr:glycosyltransferase family 4 protein [Brevibacterium sp. 50QC2O2]MCQ9388903.1 glycosyltransferase family 4 protein [Brevibacterium sp. 50QC2O2]
MRIAYLLADPGIGVFGTKGASVHVQEVIRALRRLGHSVTVYAVRSDDTVPADLADLPVVELPVARTADTAARERAIAAAADSLARAVTVAGADLVYERYSLFSTAGSRAAAALGVPFVLEVNAPLIDEQARYRELHDRAGALVATVAQLEAARVATCVSAGVADWVLQQCPGARTLVVPNGVDAHRITPAAPTAGGPAADTRTFTVGFVGTLKPWHGTHLLLEAFARAVTAEAALPGGPRVDWRLDICGKGPELESLRALATDLGIGGRTLFRGAVAPAQVPEILHGFDVATAPYPAAGDHYFSPLKVYEYLAAGLPVVASEIGEIPGLLGSDVGVLVPPGDVAELAAALVSLAHDPVRRAALGAAARDSAVNRHSWDRRCGTWLELV